MARIPDKRDLRAYNPVLSDFVSALVQDRSNYIASKLFDEIQTERTGQVWLKSTLAGISGHDQIETRRAPGSGFVRVEGTAPSLASFELEDDGLEYPLPVEYQDDSQLPYGLLQSEVEDLVDFMLGKREIRAAAYLCDNTRFTTVNIGSTSVRWTAPGANPMADLDALAKRVEIAGQNGRPDTLIFGGNPGWALSQNSRLISDLAVTRDKTGSIPWPELAMKLGDKYGIAPERVFWAKALRNEADLGLDQSNAYIWGDYVAMGRMGGASPVEIRGGVRVKGSAAMWARRKPAGHLPMTAGQDATGIWVSTYWDEAVKSTIARVELEESLVPIRNTPVQLLEDVEA